MIGNETQKYSICPKKKKEKKNQSKVQNNDITSLMEPFFYRRIVIHNQNAQIRHSIMLKFRLDDTILNHKSQIDYFVYIPCQRI